MPCVKAETDLPPGMDFMTITVDDIQSVGSDACAMIPLSTSLSSSSWYFSFGATGGFRARSWTGGTHCSLMNWLSIIFLLRTLSLKTFQRLCTLDCKCRVVVFSTFVTTFSPFGTFFSTSHMSLTTKITRYYSLTTYLGFLSSAEFCFTVSNKLEVFLISHRLRLCRRCATRWTNIDALIQCELCLL